MRSFVAFILFFRIITISCHPDYRVIRKTDFSSEDEASDSMEAFEAFQNVRKVRESSTQVDDDLHKAASEGDDETVKILIDRGANLSSTDKDGNTPLHSAAWKGHDETVKILIDRGANVSVKDNDGNTPLRNAAWNGHVKTVKVLIDRGADVNSRKNNGLSPLHEAAWFGHVETVKTLIDRGADVHSKNLDGWTPLHNAAWNGHVEAAKTLMDHGADVNSTHVNGWSPLHIAAFIGQLETARLLIAKGADPNAKTLDGETAEQIAKRRGYTDIEKLLSTFKTKSSKRPSEQACETYMQLTEDNILAIGSKQVPTDREFPWMVALGYLNRMKSKYVVTFECGGTLISDYFILTAAHCVLQRYLPSVVQLGKVTLFDDDREPENPRIKEFIRHPEYSEKTKKNDIALIRLLISVFFTSSIAPACLQTDVRDGGADVELIATGWGITDAHNQSSSSNVLRKTHLMTMPWAECNKKLLEYSKGLHDAALQDGLGQGQYCTFHPKGYDSCSGDSGGPVQHFNNSRFSTVVGVISFGVGVCGSGLPSVNTRVAYYLDWIESIVWPNGFNLQ